MTRPTCKEAHRLSHTKAYGVIPISCEIPAGSVTPIDVLQKLKQVSSHCYLLESVERNQTCGRYTFLGFDPKLEISCTDGRISIKPDPHKTSQAKSPSEVIRKVLMENRSPSFDYLPSFTGGLVGYFSYDYIKYSEPSLILDAKNEEGFKDVDLMLFDKVIAFDHVRQTIVLIVNVLCEEIEQEYSRAESELENLKELSLDVVPQIQVSGKMKSPMQPLFDKNRYCEMLEKAKEYIYDGDIFQVVLSNRLSAEFEGSLLDTYRVLRATNPSPYMFYLCGDDLEVAGASPETLVKLENGILHTFPLAGTRPRGDTGIEDKRLESELLSDEKECAEHNMLVDLGRNDLGRISKFGTVQLEKYMEIQKFSHVMHIGSSVCGRIRPDCDALSAIEAVLPAGTLSGAPKIRACEIINELEGEKRGLYGGAIGYLGLTGNLDVCIAIRMAYQRNGTVFVCSGAGIVADSVPEKEYEECQSKAKAVINALKKAQEGLI
ncbi:MAG: trpE [Evtepia sp.]|nr:trpE [Evtepia sp.]